MPVVGKRYAEALADIASEQGSAAQYREALGSVNEIMGSNPELAQFLRDPVIPIKDKHVIIKKVFSADFRPEIVNFLLLLIEKGRISDLGDILSEYGKLVDKKTNTLDIRILSATPLDDEYVSNLCEIYKKRYGASSARATVETDKDLIGGVKVMIGGKMIDGSISGRLNDLKKSVLQAGWGQ